ncbi:MAG TPA: MFS transporter [Candidatus Anoxymicrobiaceae bacterium]
MADRQGTTNGNGRGETASRSLFHGGVLSAFGERDYAVLWFGALISNTGTWVQTAALLWLIKVVLHSNSWVGAVNMANFVPVLFLVPLSGSLADRYDRRLLILIGQIVMMLGAFALGVCASLGVDSKAVILITVTIIGIAFAMNFPAWQAILPDLVPREDMLNAIALSSAQWNLARFVGPVIGAVVLTFFSPATAFYANTVSFLFVIGALLIINPKRGAIARPTNTVRHDIWEGWKYVWRRKWMVYLLLALLFISFFGFSYIVLIPGLVRDVMHRGAGAYSFLLGMTGLGAVVGAPLVTYLSRRIPERNIIKAATLGLGLMLLAFAAVKMYWLSCIVSFGLGACFLIAGSATNSVLQGNAAREMRGRVVSLYIMTFIGVSAVGGQFMGYLSDVRSLPFSLFVGGLACIVVAAVLILFPGLIHGAYSITRERGFEVGLTTSDS